MLSTWQVSKDNCWVNGKWRVQDCLKLQGFKKPNISGDRNLLIYLLTYSLVSWFFKLTVSPCSEAGLWCLAHLITVWGRCCAPLLIHEKTEAAAAAKLLQSCPTLCDPTDGSPPGSPVPGILQARTLEWGCHFLLQCMEVKSLSRVRLLETPWTAAHQAPSSMGFFRQEHQSGLPLPSPRIEAEKGDKTSPPSFCPSTRSHFCAGIYVPQGAPLLWGAMFFSIRKRSQDKVVSFLPLISVTSEYDTQQSSSQLAMS